MNTSRILVAIFLWILASYLVNPDSQFMLDVSIVVLLQHSLLTLFALATKGQLK